MDEIGHLHIFYSDIFWMAGPNERQNLENQTLSDDLVPDNLIDDGDSVYVDPATLATIETSSSETPISTDAAVSLNLAGDALEPMILTLDDLFPDENGEVVISTEDGLAISLITAGEPSVTGVSDEHVTAAGIDVSGLQFHTFDGGLTVYFDANALVEFSADLV